MRIEEISKENLVEIEKKDLRDLRLRFRQVWDKYFDNNDSVIVGSLNRTSFLKQYELLSKEMKSRKIKLPTTNIDRALFSKMMESHQNVNLIINAIDTEGAAGFILKNKKTITEEIQKPYPNEHSARLQSPDMKHIRVRRTKGSGKGKVQGVKVPTTISVIWYITRKNGKEVPIAQALRFPIDDWTEKAAKKWLKDNEIKYKNFEPAKKVKKEVKKYVCECLECGHIVKTNEHCKDIKCPKCEGEMRRKERPGIGKTDDMEKELVIIPVFKEEDEHLFCAIVYEPDVEDLQGDKMNAEEIRKACYNYMENSQVFKVKHKGRRVSVTILENYVAPVDFALEGRAITKGTWLLTTRVLDEDVWTKIKKGDLQGYSMAGVSAATYLE